MSLRINCPNCSKRLSISNEWIGKRGQCQYCRHAFDILPPTKGEKKAIPPPATSPHPHETQVCSTGQTSKPSARTAAVQAAVDSLPTGSQIWLLLDGSPVGPFELAEIDESLKRCRISLETPACLHGDDVWTPLGQLFGIVPFGVRQGATDGAKPVRIAPPTPVAPSASAPPPGIRPAATKPWSPAAIAWLALLFSPVWAGIMAAVNGRRLEPKLPIWPPLAIGFGYLFIDVLLGNWMDSYLLTLLLYLVAATLLWGLVLSTQEQTYGALPVSERRSGWGWILPCVAGMPGSMAVVLVFVVAPLTPLAPRKVCERFNAATKAGEAANYVTLNLKPALGALFSQAGEDSGDWELLDEGPAPPELGGYYVAFRFVQVEAGESLRMEGVFQLVDYSGQWKIEDIYITAINGQAFETPIVVSRDYQSLLAASALEPPSSSPPPSAEPTAPPSQTLGGSQRQKDSNDRWIGYGARGAVKYGGKAFVAALAAIGAVLAALFKGLVSLLAPRFRQASDAPRSAPQGGEPR